MLFTIYLTQTLCEERLFPIFYDSRIVNDVIKLSGNANNNADGKPFVNILSRCLTLIRIILRHLKNKLYHTIFIIRISRIHARP